MGKFKKLSFILVFMLIFTALFSSIAFANEKKVKVTATDSIALTIVHTNDTHARVEADKYAGMGFAKIATKIKQIRETNENVLVLDAGDTFHGQTIATLVKGESIVKIMNTIGYDAMVTGNHDYNYGQERLLELEGMTNFPILAANVVKDDGTEFLKPYIIKEIGGLKVGIFGLATPDTVFMTHPNNVKGLKFNDPIVAAGEMVAELNDKTDIIIALAHLGLDESSSITSEKVAEAVKGIDIMVDGHSHTTLPEGKKVNDTLIVQAGEYDKNLGIVNLTYEDGKISSINASLLTKEEAADLDEEEDVISVVSDIKQKNGEITSAVVGKTEIHLDGERADVRTKETNLGNLITSAMLKVTDADIAFTNGGGIRASIEIGDITKGDVITVLPFGNYVVAKNVTGADIVAAIEHGIDSYPETKGAFPHVAGMTFKFDPSKQAGDRLVEVKVGNELIDPNKTYKLATNDFLAAGGDGYEMLADGQTLGEYPGLDEILIEHIQKYGTEDAKVDGRVQVYEETNTIEVDITTYEVVKGDVLWRIAKKFGFTWQKIAEYNKLENPNLIFTGQKLLIPAQ
ncbi:5'-nucleotidase C-terminal domain-containing protein [Abyssisolibacter fermentans]|uniref:5'-nucleotidase C-terminal domain-containing protein n=1 Tax=Abyssisolibacter fermentans TaxID=1766203 RepID=UPI00082B234C|nr:5'-nucleotidase C-terminal domain-containing protein [Abyssisolibacter fermentans]